VIPVLLTRGYLLCIVGYNSLGELSDVSTDGLAAVSDLGQYQRTSSTVADEPEQQNTPASVIDSQPAGMLAFIVLRPQLKHK